MVELRVESIDRSEAERAERIVCDEIERLEWVSSVYDGTSLLRRWVADETVATTAEYFDEFDAGGSVCGAEAGGGEAGNGTRGAAGET